MYPTRAEKMKHMAEDFADIAGTLAALSSAEAIPPTAVNWCETTAAKLRTFANEFERLADSYGEEARF